MKRTRTKFAALAVTVLMALLCIMAAFGGLFQSAYADDSGGEQGTRANKVYYFYDYYPTLNIRMLTEEYSGIVATYDFKHIRSGQDLDDLVGLDYFSGYGKDYVVIIDIKTFKPTSVQVDNLFSGIKSQGDNSPKTIFVSAYADYTPSGYVDSFVYDDFVAMRYAIEWKLQGIYIENIAILIDHRMIDMTNYNSDDPDMDSLCESSPFLRIVLEVLYGTNVFDSYNDIANWLIDNNVKLLVQLNERLSCFLDILTGEHVDFYSFGDVINENNYQNNYGTIERVYAFGFWYLDVKFYNLLDEGVSMMDAQNFGIGIVEIDPIVYDPNGLPIAFIPDDMNGPALEMLNILHGFLI